MTRTRPRIRTAALVAALGLALPAATAGATDGNLYPVGATPWSVTSPFTATPTGAVVQIHVPARASVTAGDKWEMSWRCPVAGSEIAQVSFGAMRTAPASSLAVRVTGDGRQLWAVPDAELGTSGRGFDIGLPPGQCNVHLLLTQTETRAQHQRTYFIDNPRVLVRDLTAPAVTMREISHGWFNGTPRVLRVGWSTADNFGADGVGVQRVIVGGRTLWSGSPGVGDLWVDLDIGTVGDGVQPVVVQADGDGTPAAAASAVVLVDRTPPSLAPEPAGYPGQPRIAVVAWSGGDATSGVAASRLELAHGTGWVTLAERAGPGREVRAVAVPAFVADGAHAWRVVATDHAGNVAVAPGPGTIIVDTTPPVLHITSAPEGWVQAAEVGVSLADNLAGVLGIGTTTVDVNAAPDGSGGGEWIRVSAGAVPAGAARLPVDLRRVPDGTHRVRVTTRNGGDFGPFLATERTLTVHVDRTPPAIGTAAFAQVSDGVGRAAWTADDVHAGVSRVAVQRMDGGAWRTLADAAADDGAGAATFDAAILQPGEHRLRVRVTDAAGNVALREGHLHIAPPAPPAPAPAPADPQPRADDREAADSGDGAADGLGSAAPDPFARLRGARLSVGIPGARVSRSRGGRIVLTRRAVTGGTVPATVRLLDATGRPIGGAQVEARDSRRAVLARGRTAADGRARLRLRPDAGGPVRIGVPAGSRLLPARAERDVRLRVRARVVLRPIRGRVRAGRIVVFAGRVFPAPGRLGMAARKGVVLEWRDPLRGVWRPVVNARVRRDGTFRVPWRFALRDMAIPMRVRVPAEIGWPLLPALSRPRVVTPR